MPIYIISLRAHLMYHLTTTGNLYSVYMLLYSHFRKIGAYVRLSLYTLHCVVNLSLTKPRAAMRVATPSLERVWLRQTMVVLAFPRPAGRCASAPLIMRFAKEPVYNLTIMRMRRTLKPTCSPLIIEFRSYTWS